MPEGRGCATSLRLVRFIWPFSSTHVFGSSSIEQVSALIIGPRGCGWRKAKGDGSKLDCGVSSCGSAVPGQRFGDNGAQTAQLEAFRPPAPNGTFFACRTARPAIDVVEIAIVCGRCAVRVLGPDATGDDHSPTTRNVTPKVARPPFENGGRSSEEANETWMYATLL
jgi:hypothetical protein